MNGPPPPPPPPPPMPGFGGGPPPPPPMPGGGGPPSRPPPGRGALLGDISKGRKLKSTVTNDRSAPIVDSKPSSGGPVSGAPPIPGMRPPGGLAPPVPMGSSSNRNRSSSDGAGGSASTIEAAPQLGGLFAGGMPKLKKTRGGINTGAGADEQGAYSDSETTISRPPAFRAPGSLPPRPPGAAPPIPEGAAPPLPRFNGLRPMIHTVDSAPVISSPLAHLKKPPPRPAPKPGLSSIGLGKPPPPPPVSRKPSGQPPGPPPLPPTIIAPSLAPPPPPPPPPAPSSPSMAPPPPPPPPPPPISASPAPPIAPPPPPMSPPQRSLPPPVSATPPQRSAPPPVSVAPPPPPPPPPPPQPVNQSPAHAAARQAFGKSGLSLTRTNSTPSSPLAQSSGYGPQIIPGGSPSSNRPTAFAASSYTLSNSSYTLNNGGFSSGGGGGSGSVQIDDHRWRFQDDNALPPPRQFTGVPKKYRAGRGSTVPLDLNSLG